MNWVVYLLRCADQSLYCGITNNLSKRIQDHNNKVGAAYTKSRLPVVLVYSETSLNRSSASKREYEIKQLSRKQKLVLIESYNASKKLSIRQTK